MSISQDTLDYFKTIPSSLYTSGIPRVHNSSHLNNFENKYKNENVEFWTKVKDTTERLLALDTERCPRFIFLCGMPGSGKSHLMVGWYKAIVQKMGYSQGDGALFTTFISMASDIIAGFSDKIFTREALEGYTRSRWIFLDDFTASKKIFKEDSFDSQLFRDIVLNRWDSGYTLVTSSNIDSLVLIEELSTFFGDYLGSRLADSTIIQFPDEDLRQQGLGGHTK